MKGGAREKRPPPGVDEKHAYFLIGEKRFTETIDRSGNLR
jgi:hypothetical protein